MGIPPDIEYSDDCLACFAADETPEVIYAAFVELEWCDHVAPINRFPPISVTWPLTQTDDPCVWKYFDEFVQIFYSANIVAVPANISRLNMAITLAPGFCFFAEGVPCQAAFDNSIVEGDCAPMAFAAHSGKAQLEWNG